MSKVKNDKKVCIVIPAFREASVIQEVIKSTISTFEQSKYNANIVVVNDGSPDETAKEARLGGAIVINHIINSGAGSATATGLEYAKRHDYDIAATMDADGQHDPNDVLIGVQELIKQNADLMVGSRLKDSDGMSRLKILGNWGLSFITLLLFGVNSTDSQSGLRIFSRNAIENLRWKTAGYEFCSEMLWRAKQLNLIVKEYPIKAIYTDYSKGKGQSNWNAFNILKSMLSHRISEILK